MRPLLVNRPLISRRRFLRVATASVSVSLVGSWAEGVEPEVKRSPLGLVSYVWSIHQRSQKIARGNGDLDDPLTFLQRCHSLGASGMQMSFGVRDKEYTVVLRRFAEEHDLYVEGSVDLSGPQFDPGTFEREVQTAKSAGARMVRVVVFPGRRYEQFRSADEFARASDEALARLREVEPIAARHQIRLGVENHKDQRVSERLQLLRQISSEYVGACVDIGNSFALCEDPLEVVQAYAPWAFAVHFKDQAVRECETGFLFADVPLGEGFLDLATMTRVLRATRPDVRLSLELITRDPLVVPILESTYWSTMGSVPASDLARTLRIVKTKASVAPLPMISSLALRDQAEAESRNVERSLTYAREHLSFQ